MNKPHKPLVAETMEILGPSARLFLLAICAWSCVVPSSGADLVQAKDGSGVYGYNANSGGYGVFGRNSASNITGYLGGSAGANGTYGRYEGYLGGTENFGHCAGGRCTPLCSVDEHCLAGQTCVDYGDAGYCG